VLRGAGTQRPALDLPIRHPLFGIDPEREGGHLCGGIGLGAALGRGSPLVTGYQQLLGSEPVVRQFEAGESVVRGVALSVAVVAGKEAAGAVGVDGAQRRGPSWLLGGHGLVLSGESADDLPTISR